MLDNLSKLVQDLQMMNKVKMENGYYPICKDARYVLKLIIDECKSVRKLLVDKTHARTALTQDQRDALKEQEKNS